MGNVPFEQSADSEAFLSWAAEKSCSPEQALWKAVLMRAISDAFESSDHQIMASETDKLGDPDIVRAEARRWLVADFGDYVADREFVCLAAGVEVDDVVRMSRKRLAELKAAPAPPMNKPKPRRKKRLKNAKMSRAIKEHHRVRKEATAAGLTIDEYQAQQAGIPLAEWQEQRDAERKAKARERKRIARRKAYNAEQQLQRERNRDKWAKIAQKAAE